MTTAKQTRRTAVPDARMFSVYGRMTAQTGQRDTLIERFKDALRVGIPGLESFTINAVLDDPDTIWITQIWTDKAAHDTWTHSDFSVSATERVMSLVVSEQPPVGSYGQVAYQHDRGAA
jgi:heme-degrading monooxygenase HmoA